MGTTSFIDMLLYLRKRYKLIIVCSLLGVLVAFMLARATQQYTATVGIQYTYPGAEEGLDPLGGKLDVYEVMNPSLIATALKNMGSELSVEEVRNKMSVSPVITAKEEEAQQARIALGDVVALTTTAYNVSYTCNGTLGGAFAQSFLYYLLQAYDDYFSQKYLMMELVPDFMTVVNVSSMDYMEKCDYIDGQLTNISNNFDKLQNWSAGFTSKATGLDFIALKYLYDNLRTNQFDRLYANVRIGRLTENKDLLVQGYSRRIEDMQLNRKNQEDESDQSHNMVKIFYEQYKRNNLYYSAKASQTESSDSSNKSLVHDYDMSLMINTYDDVLMRYVNGGTNATNLKHEMEYYEKLISDFVDDPVAHEDKQDLFNRADALIAEITGLSTRYAVLGNQTLADYYGAKITENVKYTMAVEVSAMVSASMYMAIGLFIMALAGCGAAIVLEIVQVQLLRRKFELLAVSEDGTLTPEIIENMTPIEQAFYEQATTGFHEFYLMFQPIVHRGEWEISETLVRWDSRRKGQILPDEFLPIAEKYRLMDRLGEWILTQACMQSITWAEGGQISPRVSVNYSTQQIESQSFIDSICRIITESKVEPSNIYLEISGGGELHDVDQVASKFVALKALGLRLTIDRFGESVSSLRMLYDLPADMVKLDKRFLTALRNLEDRNAALLNQVISVCKELSLKICANGIEEMWQVERLEEMGAEYLQGYYFSSPLPIGAYEERYAIYVHHREEGTEPPHKDNVSSNYVTMEG